MIQNQRVSGADSGVTTILVVLFLTALLILLAFFLDITVILIRREQLETMAELGAAAGGRQVAELIAKLADDNVTNGEVPPPSEADKVFPERFLRPSQRIFLQTDPTVTTAVAASIQDYIQRNTPANLSKFDLASDLTITYPVTAVDCESNPSAKSIQVKTEVRYQYPFILSGLITRLGASHILSLSAVGLYNVRLCP